MDKLKHILVAGGAGFIGTNLCERLLDLDYKILCIDNLSTGKLENASRFGSFENYTFLEADITEDISDIIPKDIDCIINLACQASPLAYYQHPIETLLTSVIGVRNLLNIAKELNIPIIQSSTSEVYGDPEIPILDEFYNGNVSCIGPRACYDEGKRAAETLCIDYHRIYGVNVKLIRIFNTYGPYMQINDGRAIPAFIDKALKNETIVINGDGTQTRSFQYIDDLIDAIVKLMDDAVSFNYPVNVGNPNEEFSIRELANIVISLTGSSSDIKCVERLPDDPRKRRPSIRRIRDLIDWSPKVTLSEGLKRTIEFFKDRDSFCC